MSNSKSLSMAIWRYDRTQALYDGRIGVAGHDLVLTDAPLEEIFSRAFVDAEFDVSELSFSNFLRLTVAGTCPYVGIPIFPSRAFRHSAFYVRADAGIATPNDLQGRRVGVREFSMTAALAARGALRDQFGVATDTIDWVVGDVDERERATIVQPALHRPMSVAVAPAGALLGPMLLEGHSSTRSSPTSRSMPSRKATRASDACSRNTVASRKLTTRRRASSPSCT